MQAKPNPPLRFVIGGARPELVTIPARFVLDKGRTVNITRRMIGGAAMDPPQAIGDDIFADEPLDDFDDCRFRNALAVASVLSVLDPSVDTRAIDIEGGFYPWFERAHDKYKGTMSAWEYEIRAQALELQMLDVVSDAGFWGRPYPWEDDALMSRAATVYKRCTALHPCLYPRFSGDVGAIKGFGEKMRKKCEFIKAMGGAPKTVAAWFSDRYSPADKNKPNQKASIPDMLAMVYSAPWADQHVFWFQSSNQQQADSLNMDLAQGGRLDKLLTMVLGLKPPTNLGGSNADN